ncbi:TPA: hypothetical protein ACGOZB_002055 [Streptococcus suis]
MNKQEAIEKIYNASWDSPDYEGLVVKVETVNEIIYQISDNSIRMKEAEARLEHEGGAVD